MFCKYDHKRSRDWEEQIGFHTRLFVQRKVSRPMYARRAGIRFGCLNMVLEIAEQPLTQPQVIILDLAPAYSQKLDNKMPTVSLISTVPSYVTKEEDNSLCASTPASFSDLPPILVHQEGNVSITLDPPVEGFSAEDAAQGTLYLISR